MRRSLHILVLVVLFFSSVAASWGQEQSSSQSLAIAAYNVRNLFDKFDNPYTADEGTKPKPERELDALINAVKQVDADVMIMEEVEAGGVLTDLCRKRLTDYPYVFEDPTSDPRGISVAVISKIPVSKIVSHRLMLLNPAEGNKPTNRFARDLLRIDLEPQPGVKISLYGLHLKSKRDSEGDPKSANWRLAEARKIAAILKEDYASGIKNFAIMGDFNDTIDSAPLKAIFASLNTPLIDSHAHIPEAQRITFESSRYRECIDFILLSPELGKMMVPQSGTIFQGEPFTIASDHRPVKVVLDLSKVGK